MEEVGKILPGILKQHVQRPDALVVEILASCWPLIAGKAIAQQCRPVAFYGGTLTLATECSSWSAQLQQLAEEIRAEINSFLGKPVVKKLRVRRVSRFPLIEAAQTRRQTLRSPATVPGNSKGYVA